MKNQIYKLTILFIMSLGVLTAQDFQENFLRDDYMMYKGAYFKLKENPSSSSFRNSFYADLEHCQEYFSNNVIYPDVEYNFKTVPDSLENRIFLVEDITGKDGKAYTASSIMDMPILKLRDTMNNQVIYYWYNKRDEYSFPFLTSNIKIDIEVLCSKIKKKTDDFTDEIKINSPIIDGGKSAPVILYKTIKNGKAIYDLRLQSYGNTPSVDGKGVIILFEDGTKMNKPAIKIDVGVDKSRYVYSAYIQLTETEVKSLSIKKINKFRLYVYDQELKQVYAEKITNYVKCVMEAE